MRTKKGQFTKGHRASPATEFKGGQHWRNPKPYWDKDWLEYQYHSLQRSAAEIAKEQGCTENNILYFLHKHSIPRRTIAESRAVKYWGLSGSSNGMCGKTGDANPNWKGGITPERQALYSSPEWAKVVKMVWERDQAVCQRCERYTENHAGQSFHIHHIVPFAVPELRAIVDNLVLLCQPCHSWVHSRQNTEGEYLKGGD